MLDTAVILLTLICCVQLKTFSYRYNEEPDKPIIDILLRGCYLFRGMPFLRVTFIDGYKADDFMKQDARREIVVLAKRLELMDIDPVTRDTPFLDGRITERVSLACCSNVLVTSFVVFHLLHFILWYTHRGCIGSQFASPSNSPLLPSMHRAGNFVPEFPSINSRSRLFSRWRMRARSVEQTTGLAAAHAST